MEPLRSLYGATRVKTSIVWVLFLVVPYALVAIYAVLVTSATALMM